MMESVEPIRVFRTYTATQQKRCFPIIMAKQQVIKIGAGATFNRCFHIKKKQVCHALIALATLQISGYGNGDSLDYLHISPNIRIQGSLKVLNHRNAFIAIKLHVIEFKIKNASNNVLHHFIRKDAYLPQGLRADVISP